MYASKTNTIPILMHQMHISTNQVSSVVLRPKKLEIRKIVKTVKEPRKTKYKVLCHEIEENPSKDRAMHEGDVR
jgi:DNA-binding transcriptional regulator GbsR (MarR family)